MVKSPWNLYRQVCICGAEKKEGKEIAKNHSTSQLKITSINLSKIMIRKDDPYFYDHAIA